MRRRGRIEAALTARRDHHANAGATRKSHVPASLAVILSPTTNDACFEYLIGADCLVAMPKLQRATKVDSYRGLTMVTISMEKQSMKALRVGALEHDVDYRVEGGTNTVSATGETRRMNRGSLTRVAAVFALDVSLAAAYTRDWPGDAVTAAGNNASTGPFDPSRIISRQSIT